MASNDDLDESELSIEELQKKLDADLDAFINEQKLLAKDESILEGEEQNFSETLDNVLKHPAFLTEIDYSKPLDPSVEALMKLKYEEANPTACAEAYKEDGNAEFKKKKYKLAIENYTEGIKCKSRNKQLNAILYNNRAVAQFYRKNYRSALNDCIFARKFKPNHKKAIVKGAECCMAMMKYEEADRWCNAALMLDPKDQKILDMKVKADKEKRAKEKEKRKEEARERKEFGEDMKLIEKIHSLGIKLGGLKISQKNNKIHPGLLTNLDLPNAVGSKVREDADGKLVWPVLFLYPEHVQTDFIEGFHEEHRLLDHIEQMFGPGAGCIPWDVDKKYNPNNLQVYFEDKEKEALYEVDPSSTLLQVLKHKRYVVNNGTPCFILMVKNSTFQESYLCKYKVYFLS